MCNIYLSIYIKSEIRNLLRTHQKVLTQRSSTCMPRYCRTYHTKIIRNQWDGTTVTAWKNTICSALNILSHSTLKLTFKCIHGYALSLLNEVVTSHQYTSRVSTQASIYSNCCIALWKTSFHWDNQSSLLKEQIYGTVYPLNWKCNTFWMFLIEVLNHSWKRNIHIHLCICIYILLLFIHKKYT